MYLAKILNGKETKTGCFLVKEDALRWIALQENIPEGTAAQITEIAGTIWNKSKDVPFPYDGDSPHCLLVKIGAIHVADQMGDDTWVANALKTDRENVSYRNDLGESFNVEDVYEWAYLPEDEKDVHFENDEPMTLFAGNDGRFHYDAFPPIFDGKWYMHYLR